MDSDPGRAASDNTAATPAAPPQGLLERIHATPPRMVMEFAGAGSLALHWLHSVGGSSRTVLEAVDRYAPASLVGAVGYLPERFTSAEVAAALAEHALRRARQLESAGLPSFGLGLTATIATDRAKRGDHRCVLAVRDGLGLSRYELVLRKGERDRAGEEELVSLLVLRAVADACGLLDAPPPQLHEGEELLRSFEPAGPLAEFAAGEREWVLVDVDGSIASGPAEEAAILSGSFNPVHRGHLRLAEVASARLGVPVAFELPLHNAEKGEIALAETRRRATQFLGRAPLLLTRAPLFHEKARLFPGRTFVIGVDTAARLLEARFYGGEAARRRTFDELRSNGTRFLVAGREREGRFLTLADLEVPEEDAVLFEAIPEEDFREDLSSTELRREWWPRAESEG